MKIRSTKTIKNNKTKHNKINQKYYIVVRFLYM